MINLSAPRALSVYEGFFSGGARILHTDAVIGMQEAGLPQEVVSINETVFREATTQTMYDDQSYKRLVMGGVEVTTLGRNLNGKPSVEYTDLEVQRFKKLARGADIVLSLKEQPLGLINQIDGLPPVVAFLHRSDPESDPEGLSHLLKSISSGRVVTAVCCAEATRDAYARAGIPYSALEVITNGIDLNKFKHLPEARKKIRSNLGIPPEAPVVVMAARYDKIKNIPLFLASTDKYLAAEPSGHIMMCGAGMVEDNPEWQADCEKFLSGYSEFKSRIHLLGIRRDMPSVYSAADIVALTSIAEAYPLSLIEGMACGAIPVSTNVGDVAAIVNGKGFVTRADPESVSMAWRVAYKNRHNLRMNFLAEASAFDRTVMMQRYMSLINRVLGGQAQSATYPLESLAQDRV